MYCSGLAASPLTAPACCTNSDGVRKLPWQRHTILMSSPSLYLYRKPSTLLGSPLVSTPGISCINLLSTFPHGICTCGTAALPSPLEPRAAALLGANDEGGGGLAAVTLLVASPEGTDDDDLFSLVTAFPKKKNIRNEYNIELNDDKKIQ